MLFNYKSTKPKPTLQPTLVWNSHTSDHYPPALLIPGPDIRRLGTRLCPQSLVKWFTLNPILNLLTLPLVPSHGNPNKGSAPWFPFCFCPLIDPGAFPIDLPPWEFLLGTVSNKLSFTDIVFWSLGHLVPQICYECTKFKALPKCLLVQNCPRVRMIGLTWHLNSCIFFLRKLSRWYESNKVGET